jgi:hypothetical protein
MQEGNAGMSAEGMACRKCGQPAGNSAVIIYGRDQAGALAPKAAQCRGRCGTPPARQAPRPARPPGRIVVPAFRPGTCAACTWEIVPGEQIVHLGDNRFAHFECAPVEDIPLPASSRDDVRDEPGAIRPERRRRVRSGQR